MYMTFKNHIPGTEKAMNLVMEFSFSSQYSVFFSHFYNLDQCPVLYIAKDFRLKEDLSCVLLKMIYCPVFHYLRCWYFTENTERETHRKRIYTYV